MNPANPGIVIRDETDADIGAITEVTIAAFESLQISNHTEQFIIEALRADKALTVSLVAELDDRIIGHIAFSPVTIADGTRNWYGLGPVSVSPEHQHKGVGKALIQVGPITAVARGNIQHVGRGIQAGYLQVHFKECAQTCTGPAPDIQHRFAPHGLEQRLHQPAFKLESGLAFGFFQPLLISDSIFKIEYMTHST